MADDADRAQVEIERAMSRFEQQRPAMTPADSADECQECGELIPSARQIAVPGCQTCVDCAEDLARAAARGVRA